MLAGHFYVCTAGAPAVFSSVLVSSVIVIAAVVGLLSTCVIPALGLRFRIPEFLSDALFFRRCLRGLLPSVDLPFPYGQIAVVLLHKDRGVVIQPFECLNIVIAILFEDAGQPIHPTVNFLLYTCNLFLKGLTLFTLEQSGRLGKLLFELRKLPVHELLAIPFRGRKTGLCQE